jgi:hypothetical protein
MENEFEAKELIRDRMAKYCRFLDTKQFDNWEALFKPDARIVFYDLDNSVLAEFKSIAELSAMTRGLFATTQTVHQTHNSEIEFQSNTQAYAIWSMEDLHIYAPEDDQPSKMMHSYGFYYETWELIDDSWVIASLELGRTVVLHT